jgi:hypothetical protein
VIVFVVAKTVKNWRLFRAKFGIKEMCRDQWNWARKNPYGYQGPELEVPTQKLEVLKNGQIENLTYKESHDDLLHGRSLKI